MELIYDMNIIYVDTGKKPTREEIVKFKTRINELEDL